MFKLDVLAPHPDKAQVSNKGRMSPNEDAGTVETENVEQTWDVTNQAFTQEAVPSMGDDGGISTLLPAPIVRREAAEVDGDDSNLWSRKHKAASRWEWVYAPFEALQIDSFETSLVAVYIGSRCVETGPFSHRSHSTT